jgi:hypothetical protein
MNIFEFCSSLSNEEIKFSLDYRADCIAVHILQGDTIWDVYFDSDGFCDVSESIIKERNCYQDITVLEQLTTLVNSNYQKIARHLNLNYEENHYHSPVGMTVTGYFPSIGDSGLLVLSNKDSDAARILLTDDNSVPHVYIDINKGHHLSIDYMTSLILEFE